MTPFSDDEHYETISVAPTQETRSRRTPPTNPLSSSSPKFLSENKKDTAATEFTELAHEKPTTTDFAKTKESVGGDRKWCR